MPIARFQMPDGRVARFEVPDGTSPEQAQQMMEQHFAPQPAPQAPAVPPGGIPGFNEGMQGVGNLAAGAVRGAGSIGATGMRILPNALGGDTGPENDQRRQAMDEALKSMGADPSSLMYKGGKLAGEIAGTAGAGGALANGARAIPALAKFAPVIESGGFNLGKAATGSKYADALIRAGGGAIQGGTQAAMVDPEHAATGAAIGFVTPGVSQGAAALGQAIREKLGSGAKTLMQSALKPTIKQLRSGDADIAVQTLLDEGLNATKGGVEALKDKIGGINDDVSSLISGSGATVSKQKVIDALKDTQQKFATQVSPASDMAAIDAVKTGFDAHPMINGDDIPVQLAQQLKQGTYSVLSKKYGQLGSAETEAQKALARGLKEQIASAVPEVAGLNAKESALITTLGVTERRALMDANKNPMGLAGLAHNPAAWAAFMADKSAAFKSIAARMANTASKATPPKAIANAIQQHGLLGAPSVMATSP